MAELLTRFQAEGPGLPTVQLATGLQLLQSFQAELDSAVRQREQLTLAEKLFDMETSSFPSLSEVRAGLASSACCMDPMLRCASMCVPVLQCYQRAAAHAWSATKQHCSQHLGQACAMLL
jgi:hypothetical protein